MPKKTLLRILLERHTWKTQALVFAFVCAGLLIALSPWAHQLICKQVPQNPEHALLFGITALQDASGIAVTTDIVEPNKVLSWKYFQEACNGFMDERESLVPQFGQICPEDSIAFIRVLWFPKRQQVCVAFPKKSWVDRDTVRHDLAEKDTFPGFACWYRSAKTKEENLGQLRQLFVCAKAEAPEMFPKLSTDSLVALADSYISYHVRHPFIDPVNSARIVFLGMILLAECWCTGYCIRLQHQRMKRLLASYKKFRSQGIPVSRPSWFRCVFILGYASSYELKYTQKAKAQAARFYAAVSRMRKQQKNDAKAKSEIMQLNQSVAHLKEIVAEASLPKSATKQLAIAEIVANPFPVRQAAYWEVRRMLAEANHVFPENTTEVTCGVSKKTAEEVCHEVDVFLLSSEKQKQFEKFLKAARAANRQSIREYNFARALDAVSEPEGEQLLSEEPDFTADSENLQNGKHAERVDFSDLLGIRPLLPSAVDPEHAEAIILCGLLKIGQRGRSHFGKRYRTAQYVRSDVASKLSGSFRSEKFESALSWLLKSGVVIVPKKINNQTVYSLNPHANEARQEGQELVSRIISFKFNTRKLFEV